VQRWCGRRWASRSSAGLDATLRPCQERGLAWLSWIDSADLVITTYGTAQRDLEALRGLRWRRVVCDEAQAIKNSSTLQARARTG
jgi:SNF2 family DNA or RNA helicase